MNDILKQRLVGALILIALGVVFWPIIFVQPEKEEMAGQQAIPAPPEVSTAGIATPDPQGLRDSPELAAQDDSPVADELDGGVQGVGEMAGANALGGASASIAANPAKGAANAAATATATAPVSKTAAPSVAHADPVPAAGAARFEAPQRLAMDKAGVPVAWTLQVATVSSAEKADNLRKQLLAMNLKAYVTTVSSGGKRLYRVCVGPKFEKVELEAMRPNINAKFGVNSMVARYVP